MQRGLQYLTAKVFIRSPSTPNEIVESFNLERIWNEYGITKHEDNPCHFFKACIQEDGFSYCIFFSETIASIITEHILPQQRKYMIDGTFKIVPMGVYKQLLIIHVDYFEEKVTDINNSLFSDFGLKNFFRLRRTFINYYTLIVISFNYTLNLYKSLSIHTDVPIHIRFDG